jgi:beta-1,4-N-acetylglucosaminyltransferase
MANISDPPKDVGHSVSTLPGRRCFVTIGATAGFRSLLEEVLSSKFLESLAAHGFTTMDVQCGPDLKAFEGRLATLSEDERHGICVRSFGYTDDMESHLLACRGEQGVRPAGVVISHGGKLLSHSP